METFFDGEIEDCPSLAQGSADQILKQFESNSLEEVFITLARSSTAECIVDSADKLVG